MYPKWFILVMHVSHLTLVFSSSVNFYIYLFKLYDSRSMGQRGWRDEVGAYIWIKAGTVLEVQQLLGCQTHQIIFRSAIQSERFRSYNSLEERSGTYLFTTDDKMHLLSKTGKSIHEPRIAIRIRNKRSHMFPYVPNDVFCACRTRTIIIACTSTLIIV